MMSNIKDRVLNLPQLQQISTQMKSTIKLLLDQFQQSLSSQINICSQQEYFNEFDRLFSMLANPTKMSILNDVNHRALIVAFIKNQGIQHYKYSYYNRAKLTKIHIKKLNQVGPILFSQAVMIASKINLINKNNSRLFIEDHLYSESASPVDLRIQEILKLCDQKKRNVNNNFKKLELILEGDEYVEVIKELGKMLRDSWKKDKSKNKLVDIVPTKKHMYHRPYVIQKHQQQNRYITQSYQAQSQQESLLQQQQYQQNSLRNEYGYDFDRMSGKLSFGSSQKEVLQQYLYAKHSSHEYQLLEQIDCFSEKNSNFFDSPDYI